MNGEKARGSRVLPYSVDEWARIFLRLSPQDGQGTQCLYCFGVNDDEHHIFNVCGKCKQGRTELEVELGNLTPETIINVMLRRESSVTLHRDNHTSIYYPPRVTVFFF